MKKIVLREDQMPTSWYNVVPDIPGGLQPPLDPETLQPMGPEKLAAVFPMVLLEQEMSQERFVEIPQEVMEVVQDLATFSFWSGPISWKRPSAPRQRSFSRMKA